MTTPRSARRTTLHIGVDHTTVTADNGTAAPEAIRLLIGSGKTASDFFKHTPPTPLEMENAIMAVEDEVTRARPLASPHSPLHTGDEAIRAMALLAGIANREQGMTLTVEVVERLFDSLAAVTLGRPAASSSLPTDTRFAATLLILREFMHHLQSDSITIDTGRG